MTALSITNRCLVSTREVKFVMSTINPDEVAKFDGLADTWWDEQGPMRVLHRFNPSRLEFIRDEVCSHFTRDTHHVKCLENLQVLDIGCGGGLVCEPLARMGAQVTGLEPALRNLEVARQHAKKSGLVIDYRAEAVETLAARDERFDVVLALEVVEHVRDVAAFIKATCDVVKPGGLLIMATLNRTLRSYAFAIVGAEYVLGWLPKGTHDWNSFIKPEELEAVVADEGLTTIGKSGVVYQPFQDQWLLSKDMAVNYMMSFGKAR